MYFSVYLFIKAIVIFNVYATSFLVVTYKIIYFAASINEENSYIMCTCVVNIQAVTKNKGSAKTGAKESTENAESEVRFYKIRLVFN